VHEDDRGSLFEVLHAYELPQDRSGHFPVARFGQVYIVRSPASGTIRGLHRHKRLWDYFCCTRGRAKVVVVQAEVFELKRKATGETLHTAPTQIDMTWTFILTADQPKVLTIGPGLWHGWKALDDDTSLVCIGSEVYNREAPDEERIAWDAFGASLWEVTPR
jgi:dTDP-4-dehydrorhamnose 3,5-epimerase-like enzyme